MVRSLKSPSRRAVLGLVAIALPVLAAPGGAGWLHRLVSPSHSEGRQWARALVAAGTRAPQSAAHVGRQYLRTAPQEKSIETLVALVLQQLPDAARLMEDPNPDRIRGELMQSVRDDFANGRTARVHGWVLSATEARLAALAALV